MDSKDKDAKGNRRRKDSKSKACRRAGIRRATANARIPRAKHAADQATCLARFKGCSGHTRKSLFASGIVASWDAP